MKLRVLFFVSIVFLFLFCFCSFLQTQENDHNKIQVNIKLQTLDKIEIALKKIIRYSESLLIVNKDVKEIDLINSLSLNIEVYLTDLKKEFNTNIDSEQQRINDILNTIKSQLSICEKQNISNMSKELIKYIDNYKKSLDEIQKLKESLKVNKLELEKRKKDLNSTKSKNDEITRECEILKAKNDYLEGKDINFGISFTAGLNFMNGGRYYLISKNHTLIEKKEDIITGTISAILVIQVSPKLDLYVNVPLIKSSLDFKNFDSLFNKTVDIGFGIGIPISGRFSVCCIVNFTKDEIIDDEALQDNIYPNETSFTVLDLSKHYTSRKPTIGINFGIVYKFGQGKSK